MNPNAEADYQAFISRGLTPLSLMPMGPDNQAFMEPGSPVHQQRLRGLNGHGHHGHAVGASAGAGPAQYSQWAAEFAATSTSGPGPAAATRAPLSGHLHSQQPLQAVNRLQHVSMGVAPGLTYTPPGYAHDPTDPYPHITNFALFPRGYSMAAHVPGLASPASATAASRGISADASSAPSGVGGLTEAQLEAQFAAAQAEMDFEDEMNSWMAVHGPTAEESAAAQEQQINEELEHVADELDAQRAAAAAAATSEANADVEGLDTAEALAADAESVAAVEQAREEEELARIAGTIVNTLSANPNTRFHESSFMQLMRRMEAREVTVRGDSLVEEATGRPIEVVVQNAEQQRQEQSQQQPEQQNSEV